MADNSFLHTPSDPFFDPSPEALARHAEAERAMTRAYRVRGRMIPLVGALTSLLFAVLVPCWYKTWAGYATPITVLALGAIPMIMAIPITMRRMGISVPFSSARDCLRRD
jgi:hypothetical protein